MTASSQLSLAPTTSSTDRWATLAAAVALLLLYVPTIQTLNVASWRLTEQSYGPVILAASLWLFWQRRGALGTISPRDAAPLPGYLLLGLSLVMYTLGRSQSIIMLESLSAVLTAVALMLLTRGWMAVRVMALPLVLLLLVVPLPSDFVVALTGPLKSAVSTVAAELLAALGYPVARSGVVLMVGQYQLLVADACAGLTSIFTLEAIGLVYMGLRNYSSRARNVTLALLLVPISFVSNVIRVLVLVLITYHFGDDAGQGFIHSAAGIVLFMVATVLMLLVDRLLDLVRWSKSEAAT